METTQKQIYDFVCNYFSLLEKERRIVPGIDCDLDLYIHRDCCEAHRSLKKEYEKIEQQADRLNADLKLEGVPTSVFHKKGIKGNGYSRKTPAVLSPYWLERLVKVSGIEVPYPRPLWWRH